MSYLFLGDGRLSRHLCYYLGLHGEPCSVWSRRSPKALKDVAKHDHIFCLGFADKDLEPWARFLQREYPQQVIVHFSGALQISGTLSFHPLFSFGPKLYREEDYGKIPFVGIDGQTPFADVFPKLSNPVWTIPPEKKATYHALVSMAANFPQILWREIDSQFQHKLDVPFSALSPLLTQSLVNSLDDPQSAPTGPIVRADLKVIARHLDAIDDPKLRQIYFAFMGLYPNVIHSQSREATHEPR